MPNTALPIYSKRDEILSAVRANPVTIVIAETGAGKSTQLPQYLFEEGYSLVVAQPRRLAARVVAARVAEELNTPLGGVVGFRTAYERQDSMATRCLFVTDGLALVRELMGGGRHTVLVLDEVHEWNLNIEVLVAWAKHRIEEGVGFRLVLMSATLEADRLSAYFGGAPVITVAGRAFPVEERTRSGVKLEDDVVNLLRQGRNVLVFQPGKRRIASTIKYLQRLKGLNAEILPLHGELTSDEQVRCFRFYGRPKCVVSTNVAQTSVTIPDIDAVVDCGLERRVELVDGIEGLYLRPISRADRAQRRGRAGRTKPGIYIDWCPSTERSEFSKAEILRVRLDQTVLRLAEAGVDMETLRFFHQPDPVEIHDAKRMLVALGCMDAAGQVTQTGHRVAKMPIAVKYGRMVVEAERLGVVDSVITVAAILEQGGITARVCSVHKELGHNSCLCWRRLAPGEEVSDVIAQLLVYQACDGMSREGIWRNGVFGKAFDEAREKRRQLVDALRGKVYQRRSGGAREQILRAVCAGMVDHLYWHQDGLLHKDGDEVRELVHESVVATPGWVVGEPFDLQVETRRGLTMLRLVRMATKVKPAWLVDVAPQLARLKTGLNPHYDWGHDEVMSTTEIWFNGQLIKSHEVLDPDHAEAAGLRRVGRYNRQWQEWVQRPVIALPDPANEKATIPDVISCGYGADAETGKVLIAYGALVPNDHRQHPSDPWFEVLWTRSEVEAEQGRGKAVEHLENLRVGSEFAVERQRRTERAEQLRAAAEPLHRLAVELWRIHGQNPDLSVGLRNRMQIASQLPPASDTRTIRLWMIKAEGLAAALDAELAVVQACKAEDARRLTKLVEDAQTLRNEANGLLAEHNLSGEQHNRLTELDVDDECLPTDETELSEWISHTRAILTEVRKSLSRPGAIPESQGGGVSDDALAALAERFKRN